MNEIHRSVKCRVILLAGQNHPVCIAYARIRSLEEKIAYDMFVYTKLISEVRSTDEKNRKIRALMDQNSAGPKSFQRAPQEQEVGLSTYFAVRLAHKQSATTVHLYS